MILVTGAAGNLGRAVVARLGDVKTFTRKDGDIGDAEAIDRAVAGCDVVVHCAATMRGAWADFQRGTIDGTRNVLAACKRHGVKQLVYISSLSVVDWAGSDRATVDEHTPFEPRPEERGFYTQAKLAAERLVAGSDVPHVTLRPGQIFGGGIPVVNGAVARKAAGRYVVLGDGHLELPLVFVDDVADAIALAIDKRVAHGEVIHVVDPERVTQRDVLAGKRAVHVPRALVLALGKASELPARLLGRTSPIAKYRLASALSRIHYDASRAQQLLGWTPRVGVREGLRRVT